MEDGLYNVYRLQVKPKIEENLQICLKWAFPDLSF